MAIKMEDSANLQNGIKEDLCQLDPALHLPQLRHISPRPPQINSSCHIPDVVRFGVRKDVDGGGHPVRIELEPQRKHLSRSCACIPCLFHRPDCYVAVTAARVSEHSYFFPQDVFETLLAGFYFLDDNLS